MVPFIASAVYGIYLGVSGRVSHLLSPNVYLTVTRDPILFLLGTFCVLLGVVLEVSYTSPPGRAARLGSVAETLQTIAVASFILAIVCALYANGFGNVSAAATDFITGRFAFIFPITMVICSILITARFNLSSIGTSTILGIVAMLLVPVSLYAIGRHHTFIGLALAFVLILGGLGLFLLPAKKAPDQEKTSSSGQ